MRPIAEVTDDCEKEMKPHELFSWENWWTDVIKNGEIPARKTYKHEKWIMQRSKLKQKINKELERRKSPNRLICPGGGQGIYIVNEMDVAEITADEGVRKIIRCFEKRDKEIFGLLSAMKISIENKRMLSRLRNMFELQQSTIIGMIANMRSLPPATKKRILKHLGIENKKAS